MTDGATRKLCDVLRSFDMISYLSVKNSYSSITFQTCFPICCQTNKVTQKPFHIFSHKVSRNAYCTISRLECLFGSVYCTKANQQTSEKEKEGRKTIMNGREDVWGFYVEEKSGN